MTFVTLHVKLATQKTLKDNGRNVDIIDEYFTTNETKPHTHPN
jgi:hypothetical protein